MPLVACLSKLEIADLVLFLLSTDSFFAVGGEGGGGRGVGGWGGWGSLSGDFLEMQSMSVMGGAASDSQVSFATALPV